MGSHGCPLRQKRSWTLDFQFSISMGRADVPWPDVMPRSTRRTRSAVGRALLLAFDQWCQCPTEAPVTMGGASGERSGGKGLRWAEGMGRLSLFILLCLSMAVWNMFHIRVRSSGSLWGSWFVTLLNSYLILSHWRSLQLFQLWQLWVKPAAFQTWNSFATWPARPHVATGHGYVVAHHHRLQQAHHTATEKPKLAERPSFAGKDLCFSATAHSCKSLACKDRPWPARTAVWNKISWFIQVQRLRVFFFAFLRDQIWHPVR